MTADRERQNIALRAHEKDLHALDIKLATLKRDLDAKASKDAQIEEMKQEVTTASGTLKVRIFRIFRGASCTHLFVGPRRENLRSRHRNRHVGAKASNHRARSERSDRTGSAIFARTKCKRGQAQRRQPDY